MAEPDWAKVLQAMYEDEEQLGYPPEVDETHPLVEHTELEMEKVRVGFEVLEKNGWIDENRFSMNIAGNKIEGEYDLSLTREGFNVAHERDLKKQQNRVNKGLVFLTMILAITAIFEAGTTLAPSFLSSNLYNTMLFLSYGFFVLIIFLNAENWLDISPI